MDLPELVPLVQKCKSLDGFREVFWPVVEPHRAFVPGWHISCINEHLEEVARPGETMLPSLIINLPPRCMKSLLVNVFWFAHTWTTQPGSRWMFASFSNELVTRDSLRCRTMVAHPLYKRMWDLRVKTDQDRQLRFTNQHEGFRYGVTVNGQGMGEGSDFLCIDDPINPKRARSEVELNNVITWYRATFSRRANDEQTVRKVLIMQRLNERDLTGHLLAEGIGWHHLCLPMRYEPARYFFGGVDIVLPTLDDDRAPPADPDKPPEAPQPVEGWVPPEVPQIPTPEELAANPAAIAGALSEFASGGPHGARPAPPRDCIRPTPLQLARPHLMDGPHELYGPKSSGRVNEGDLLWPSRFPEWVVEKAEAELGPDAPGQYAQRPSSASGDIFQEESFRQYEPVFATRERNDTGSIESYLSGVRLHGPDPETIREFPLSSLTFFQTIDTALSENSRSAFTAGVTMFATPEFDLGIWHVWRARLNVQYQYPAIKSLRAGPITWNRKTRQIVQTGRWPFQVAAQAVEPKASGIGIIQAGAADGNPFHPLKVDKGKAMRAGTVATMYLNGKVYHPRQRYKWVIEMEEELKTFPNGAFKDVGDCIAYGGQLLVHDKIIRAMCQSRVMADPGADPPEDEDVVQVQTAAGPVEVDFGDDGPFGQMMRTYFG